MLKDFAVAQMNSWAAQSKPFVFLIDFLCQKPLVMTLEQASQEFLFELNGFRNYKKNYFSDKKLTFTKQAIDFEEYRRKFEYVKEQILYGNSFLVNLTQPTQIWTNFSLEEIFYHSQAKYRFLWKDKLVFFSPESFVQISNNQIATFPMKGTIAQEIPNAQEIILSDAKEAAEHATIVDLLRNDLSQIARDVRVEKYRYLEKIQNNQKNLLQVSSKIVGKLPLNFKQNLGEIIFSLLPAGSISGAPKAKTLEIIQKAENYERGYFTGVCGYFDGQNLDSCVVIRYIEHQNQGFIFKSGGGITCNSVARNEYDELVDKVYLPIF